MSLTGSVIRSLRVAAILYAAKVAAAMIVALPVMSYLNSVFGLSRLTDNFWPIPDKVALIELFWHSRDLILVLLPLFLIAGIGYFVAAQFLYGGICAYLLGDDRFSTTKFLSAGGRYFGGFLKIALAAIPVYIIVFLIADLVGLFLGKIVGFIAGDTLASVVTVLVIFLALYSLSGYLINLRFAQIKNDNSSLRFAVKFARHVLGSKLKHFLALNMIAGVFSLGVMVIPFLILMAINKLEYSTFALWSIVIVQQVMVFLGSLIETIQISINRRIIKEYEYGT